MAVVLSNPLRPVLLAAGRSSRLGRTITRLGPTRRLVNRFVETLKAGDTSCAQQVRPIRSVPAFAPRVEQVAPATPAQKETFVLRQRPQR